MTPKPSAGLLKKHPGIILASKATLRDAMEVMTKTRLGMVLVADDSRRLLGILNDVDIRKALLRGLPMSTAAAQVMNRNPLTVSERATPEEIAEVFRKTSKSHVPVIDAKGRVKDLAAFLDYVAIPRRYPNTIVLMAGGMGKRLHPLTQNTPKPMLRFGDKPLLELLLEQLVASGFSRFILTVNYLADQIEGHFGDGSRWNVHIEYVRESRPLGTVGALSLIEQRFEQPLLVINGDILTKVNFRALLDFHKAEGRLATLCVKSHEVQIPYGVVEIDRHGLTRFVEKPTHRVFINAGIYVLEPKVLTWLKRGARCDMPDLIGKIRRHGAEGVACFPIEEYWLDIGGMKEFERAMSEYDSLFKNDA